ncbi:unnamed protein product, partial [Prorocentrum cordatum]
MTITLFREWAEQEIIVHFELIQAMVISDPSVNQLPIALPKDLDALKMICRKLAYGLGASDPWVCLGLARFEGPVPSEQLIAARLRTALALCDLTGKAPLDEEGHASIHKIADEFRAAALACEKELLGVLAERKRLKPIRLQFWKELGTAARALLCSPVAPGCRVTLLAQWSSVLPDCGDSVNFVDISRRVSELLEKGDEKAWDLTACQHVVAWAPDDAGALARLLAAFLRRSEPAWRPASLQMVVPLPLAHGMKDVVGVTDLWHVQTGLAIFGISLDSARHVPRMVKALTPLFEVDSSIIALMDLPSDYLPHFLALLADPALAGLVVRQHRRSASSSPDPPRICLDLVFPATCAELDAIILLDRLRRSMATTMTLLSRTKALVISVAASDTWVGVMDHILKHDPEVSASRLRWRSSAHGGRPVAAPSATTAALAAARRKAHSGGGLEHMADIVVQGELGTQDSKAAFERFFVTGEVRKLHASLRGQVIRVGNEHVRVEILNDSILALSRPGNGTGMLRWGAIRCIALDGSECWFIEERSIDLICEPFPPNGAISRDISVALWSAQAFFAAAPGRQEMKCAHVHSLLNRAQVVMITEAHGNGGGSPGVAPPQGTAAWWPAGAATAHSGISLIVKETLLKCFDPDPMWNSYKPGRAAKLELRGPEGALDLVVAYFPTGAGIGEQDMFGFSRAERGRASSFHELRGCLRARPSRALAPRQSALAIPGGDFNYVADDFDRVYMNRDVTDQIDRQLRAAALEWRPQLSAHRPVLVSRTAPQRLSESARRVPDFAVQRPDFKRRVALEFEGRLATSPSTSGLAKLQMFKEAVKQVARRIAADRATPPTAEPREDRLGMKCLARCPPLRDLVHNPCDFSGNLSVRLRGLRHRAAELARDHALGELATASVAPAPERGEGEGGGDGRRPFGHVGRASGVLGVYADSLLAVRWESPLC